MLWFMGWQRIRHDCVTELKGKYILKYFQVYMYTVFQKIHADILDIWTDREASKSLFFSSSFDTYQSWLNIIDKGNF